MFRNQNFRDFHIDASDWKGGQVNLEIINKLSHLSILKKKDKTWIGEISNTPLIVVIIPTFID